MVTNTQSYHQGKKDVPTDIVKASSLSQQNKDQHNLIKCVGG